VDDVRFEDVLFESGLEVDFSELVVVDDALDEDFSKELEHFVEGHLDPLEGVVASRDELVVLLFEQLDALVQWVDDANRNVLLDELREEADLGAVLAVLDDRLEEVGDGFVEGVR
jgi:hypothetical protein